MIRAPQKHFALEMCWDEPSVWSQTGSDVNMLFKKQLNQKLVVSLVLGKISFVGPVIPNSALQFPDVAPTSNDAPTP